MWDRDEERAKIRVPVSALVVASPTAPPYGQRRGWVPRSLEVCFKIYFNKLIKIILKGRK